MATFPIYPLHRFERGQASIRRPRESAYFSFDELHQLQPLSDASLRYYYPPFIAAPGTNASLVSLSKGFNSWIKGDDSVDGHLDALLESLRVYEEQLLQREVNKKLDDASTKADIITWRGMLTKIMTAPFDMFSDFEMNATCYQGTIYIEENHVYKQAMEQQNSQKPQRRGQETQDMMQYWGHKFESLSVLRKPWAECTRAEIEARDDDIVNSNIQYCSIVRTGIGSTSLILGGEVDCIMGEKPTNADDPIPWIELKTTAEPPNSSQREQQKSERKLLKFWAQSFLIGVPKVIVGYRTQDGHLTRIEELETRKIPGQVLRGQGSWDGNVCINFTAAFLEFLKQTISGQDGVWRIRRKLNSREIEVFKIEDTGTGEILRPTFKAHREKMLASEIVEKLGTG